MRLSLAIASVVAAAACRSAPSPAVSVAPAAEAAQPTGDELFAAGKNADAVVAYEHELERGDRVVELRLFTIAARLAGDEPSWTQSDALRELAHLYPRSRWGRLAGVLAEEIERSTVLRQAVMAAGADLRTAQDAIAQRDQRITALTAQTTEQQASLAALREERTKLTQQLKDADDRETASAAKIRELEAELAALKQVDLERAP